MPWKQCTRCQWERPVEVYYHDSRTLDCLSPVCRDCRLAQAHTRYWVNPFLAREKQKRADARRTIQKRASERQRYWANRDAEAGRKRKIWYKTQYGLTIDQYFDLLDHQQDHCLICYQGFSAEEGPKGSSPHVDHDHSTGKIRGILCGSCNKALGLLKDRPKRCLTAAIYLQNSLCGI